MVERSWENMTQRYFYDKTVEFNLYLEDTSGKNLRKVKGVISVELPKVTLDRDGNLLDISKLRIFFAGVENALTVVTAEETHMRVKAAEQLTTADGGYALKQRQHIFTVNRENMGFSPGYTKQGEPACALCEFTVKTYTMTFDAEEVLYGSMDDKVLRIN